MSNVYHATPYDNSASGFYFSAYKEYLEKSANHKNEHGDPVDEYEIQFIDGDNYALFTAFNVCQATLRLWFEAYEDMSEEEAVKAIYLRDYTAYDMKTILEHLDDVCIFEGSAEDYAENFIEETGMLDEMPENLRYYFDTQAFARDLVLNGDIDVIEVSYTQYVVWGI